MISLKDEIKEILARLEIVARKHTIRVCDDGSKMETMPASVVDELRLNNFSAKLLLDYITNLQKENKELLERFSSKIEEVSNLIKENERLKEELKNRPIVDFTFDTYKELEDLKEENQRLKNLCDKYEEEHNTTFKLWKMKMEEMPTYEEKIEMQKENQRLKEENNKLINEPTIMKMSRIDSVVANIYRNHKEQEDYKSRCEKAIEYIKEKQKIQYKFALSHIECDDLLNILNGGKDK